jgi:hypothetical protein
MSNEGARRERASSKIEQEGKNKNDFVRVLGFAHKAGNYSMKGAALVVERLAAAAHTLLASAQRSEVFCRLWVHLWGAENNTLRKQLFG